MILYELLGSEGAPAYQKLNEGNLLRQYDFLDSVIETAISVNQRMISTVLIKALNYHAIACLHVKAGEYRPCEVKVPGYKPPEQYRVPALMDDFVNVVNAYWTPDNSWTIAAFCLWNLNRIHPFINGNGRTARALCYYVICVNAGGLLPGNITLPERLRYRRAEYITLLKETDQLCVQKDQQYLKSLRIFIEEVTTQQIGNAPPPPSS